MNEIEKLRRENSELKNKVSDYRRVLRQSNSQGSMQIMPLDTVISPIEVDVSRNIEKNQVQLIDLRMSIGQEDGITKIMEGTEEPNTDLFFAEFVKDSEE